MKRSVFLSLMVLSVFSGCKKEADKPRHVYTVQVSYLGERYSSHGVDQKDNELYCMIKDGVGLINDKYETQELGSDPEAFLISYDKALAEMNALMSNVNNAIASGKDYGPSVFDISYKCVVMEENRTLKASDTFTFSYECNTRIDNGDELIICVSEDTESGNALVSISKDELKLTVLGYKLYEPDGTPSKADIIKNVEIQSVPGNTGFLISYQAKKGLDEGEYYLLITFRDRSDEYDYKVKVTHKS